jgi:polysaccharide biosynthesis transport protein
MDSASPTREGRDFRSLAAIAWRRRWVVVLPMLAGLLAGLVIGHPKVLHPVYRASSTLLLEFPQPVSRELQGILPETGMQEQLARLQSIMQSNEFLLKVADKTGLRDDPGLRKWVAKSSKQYPDMSVSELQDLRLTQWLRESIRMGRGRAGENVIVISVVDYIPDRARLIAQNLTMGVIEANRSASLDRVRSLHDFSVEQLVVYKQRLSEAEQRLEEAQRGLAAVQVNTSLVNDANLGDTRRLRTDAAADLDRLVRDRDSRKSSMESQSATAAAVLRAQAGSSWSPVATEIQQLEKDYAEATIPAATRTTQGSETIALVIARKTDELAADAARFVRDPSLNVPASLQADAAALLVAEVRVTGAARRLAAYDALLDAYQGRSSGTPVREATLKRLSEEVETDRALYNAFVQQLASSQISEAFETTKAAGRLTVIEPASRPMAPIKPNRVAVAILATIIGLAFGIGGLVLLERDDQTFRDARETERALGLRVLGTLPQIDLVRKAGRGEAFTWNRLRLESFLKDSPAYQELRRVILEVRSEEEGAIRSLLVTSARGGEGKTTTCVLLGATLATEDPQVPVLLVDMDFRRGSLGRLMGLEPDAPGVIKALETRRIDDAWFRKTPVSNLHILPLGTSPAPRNDLMTFENLSWLIPELGRRYGRLILDSPPNVPVPDALIIGQLVDAVVIILKAGATPRHLVERGVELQKQFTGNVRGLLMNNVEETMPYYNNHRYYGYPYGAKG